VFELELEPILMLTIFMACTFALWYAVTVFKPNDLEQMFNVEIWHNDTQHNDIQHYNKTMQNSA
jgi:hypothetical protein